MKATDEPLLEATGVSKVYPGGVQALAGVSLQVARGETLAVIGESGCGKSTLLRMFNALEEPSEGVVRAFGRNVVDQDPIALRRRVGYVPQNGGLLPHWTVERNVGLVPRLLGHAPGPTSQRAHELLDSVGLAPNRFAARYPHELSGGQRQRVALARALAAEPEVVLLDEPFGALDAITRVGVQDVFQQHQQELGKAMVLITHDLDEAFRLGDRIAVLRAGRLLQIGEPDALRKAPEDEYVRALVAHRPVETS